MKKKKTLRHLLSFVIAFIMMVGCCVAEAEEEPVTEQPVQGTSVDKIDVVFNVYAMSYDKTYSGMSCICSINKSTYKYVTVKSGCSGSTLYIITRSYYSLKDSETLNMNGSSGAGGYGSASTGYSTTSYANLIYNEHQNTSTGYIAQGWLHRTP
jgi:hypothetical protein